MKREWKEKGRWLWREWIKPLSITAIIVVSFRSAVADWNDVPSGSMKPTILEGDRIFVNKLAYDLRFPLTSFRLMQWEGPMRGDIVVCFSPYDGIRLVKRCVGVPGDRIAYQNGQLSINGESMQYGDAERESIPTQYIQRASQYHYAHENLTGVDHLVMTHTQADGQRPFGPIVLGKDEYFMMGDNRDESFDSRYFGVVPRNSILGKAQYVAMSFNPEQYYFPRWERFLRELQ